MQLWLICENERPREREQDRERRRAVNVVVHERVVVIVVVGKSGAFYRIQHFCSYLWNDLAYLKNETCGEVSECIARWRGEQSCPLCAASDNSCGGV